MAHEITITGAGGLLGGSMYEHLKKSGENVIGTTLTIESEIAQKLGFKRLDTSDLEATKKFVWDNLPNTFYHFAGIARPGLVNEKPELGEKVNIGGVLNLFEAIEEGKKKDNSYSPVIIAAGSVEEFGDAPLAKDNNPITIIESTPKNPLNIYAEQKKLAGELAFDLSRKYKTKLIWIYEGQATGVSENRDISQEKGYFVPDIASQIAAFEKNVQDGKVSPVEPQILRTGVIGHKRNFIDVRDAVKAYVAIAKESNLPSDDFIVCADKSVTLKEILDILINHSVVPIIHEIDKSRGAGAGVDRYYSNQKIKSAANWKPEIPLEETLRLVLEYQRKLAGVK